MDNTTDIALAKFEGYLDAKKQEGLTFAITPNHKGNGRLDYQVAINHSGTSLTVPYGMGIWHGTASKADIRKAIYKTSAHSGMSVVDFIKENDNPRITKHSGWYVEVCAELNNIVTPSHSDILQALFMDAQDSDQPFEDWANDLGYGSDSISAKETWTVCNDERRALERIFSHAEYEAMQELADEM